ncbi:transmembrane protein, putative (macronuclear) [Tetrahymena thermophila SB210]|uniref:Transmembrane protein, putative n=1 Tax=Tetrahymena thermophila (strain SB210) TaxID=312017 RepID=I7MMF0_TETTS|nr:transmembrane protein, putative [Tetrahymena thermophila SB210]EAS04724.1 transmembrane protein, putative [Tetrahymena thermophila SB210]|eukprot:XP_001024969.1 transmembrane protein, putative [Tetrahymena thermophila SB210]
MNIQSGPLQTNQVSFQSQFKYNSQLNLTQGEQLDQVQRQKHHHNQKQQNNINLETKHHHLQKDKKQIKSDDENEATKQSKHRKETIISKKYTSKGSQKYDNIFEGFGDLLFDEEDQSKKDNQTTDKNNLTSPKADDPSDNQNILKNNTNQSNFNMVDPKICLDMDPFNIQSQTNQQNQQINLDFGTTLNKEIVDQQNTQRNLNLNQDQVTQNIKLPSSNQSNEQEQIKNYYNLNSKDQNQQINIQQPNQLFGNQIVQGFYSQRPNQQYQVEYLSLLFTDEQDNNNNNNSNQLNNEVKNKNKIFFFFLMLLLFIIYSLFGYIVIFIIFIISAFREIRGKLSKVCILFWTLTSCAATLYVFGIQFYYYISDTKVQYLLFDINSFQLAVMLVISYVRACYVEIIDQSNMFKSVLNFDTFRGLIYLNSSSKDSEASLFDIPFSEPISAQNIQQRYSLLTISPIPSQLNYSISKLLSGFQDYYYPNFHQYLIIVCILILKFVLGFYYLYSKHNHINIRYAIDITITVFVYLYSAFILIRILGNYDLIRKADQMNNLNDSINFQNLKQEKYQEKLDFTCPISLETWDNARQYVCSIDLEFLSELEYAYFGLFFYFIFVSVIITTAYGEFYWIIPKESILLEPYMVILNTFNFLIVNSLLFFRLWYGQQFNDTFELQQQSLEFLMDIVEDIQLMYEAYFEPFRFANEQIIVQQKQYGQNKVDIENIKRQQREKYIAQYLTEVQSRSEQQIITQKDITVDKYSIQGLLIQRVKQTSNFYIDEKVQYQGKVYQKQDKALLRKKILKNIYLSLNKVITSIKNDAEKYQYQFLNCIPVSFSNTLTTFAVALFTLLPQVIPKFLGFYQDISQNSK